MINQYANRIKSFTSRYFIIGIISIIVSGLIVSACKPLIETQKETVETPVFTPVGGTYSAAQDVVISCATSGSEIRYTTDSNAPTSSSQLYTQAITVRTSQTVKARAYKASWTESAVASASYTITGSEAVPTFSPAAGTYITAQTVTITCTTPEAEIRYTTDGSDPTASSALYSTAITVSATQTIKARAFKAGGEDSAIATALYTITGTVAMPVFNPVAGIYTTAQTVTISCSTPEAEIRYTTDGSDPTVGSNLYTTAIAVSVTQTIKAKAFKTDSADSAVAIAAYTITGQVAAPTFSPAAGTYTEAQTVTITCGTPGAEIRYTIDGSDPTASSELYTAVLTISGAHVVRARAFKDGWLDSPVVETAYTVPEAAAAVVLSPIGGTYSTAQTITITCATPSAGIRYTIDGSDPTEYSTLYSVPFTVGTTQTVKARAFKSGLLNSAVATASYLILNLSMVPISGGTMSMQGTSVTLSHFWMGKYEVTQEQYQAIMGTNPSYYTGIPNRPVEMISWYDAVRFCNALSVREGLQQVYSIDVYDNVTMYRTNDGYRLPTEAEWEFAARGGTQSLGYTYPGSNDYNAVAWYYNNSNEVTHVIGFKAANELGLHDMSGNVNEWCWDYYQSPFIGGTNPEGAPMNQFNLRTTRGGGFTSYSGVQSSYRPTFGVTADIKNDSVGFRLVRTHIGETITTTTPTTTIPSVAVTYWGFDSPSNLEGWANFNNWSFAETSNGHLRGRADGTDMFTGSPAISIDASAAKKIKISMFVSESGNAQIFFITATNPGWDAEKSINFALVGTPTAVEYVLDMSTVAGWTGTVTQLRIDPTNISGVTVGIDYIGIYQ